MSDQDVRTALASTIQATAADDDDLYGAVLLGFVTVVEWMAPDGKRGLSRVDGDALNNGLPEWTREGYLHNALFDSNQFVDDELDDDQT